MNPKKPYNTLPKLLSKFNITPEIGLKCGDARAALGGIKRSYKYHSKSCRLDQQYSFA